jgi:hypothetical protein
MQYSLHRKKHLNLHRCNSALCSERRQGQFPLNISSCSCSCPSSRLCTYLIAQLVYLPESSDFIAPASQVHSLSTRVRESTFVHTIRDVAQNSGVWVGVGIHEVVSIIRFFVLTIVILTLISLVEERLAAATNRDITPNCLSVHKAKSKVDTKSCISSTWFVFPCFPPL